MMILAARGNWWYDGWKMTMSFLRRVVSDGTNTVDFYT